MSRTVLFHVQHFLGIGHLVRAFAIAEALATEFRVVVASGGRFPPGIVVPPGIEVVSLPALGFTAERALISHEPGLTLAAVMAERERQLLDLYDRTRPDIVLIELFPFGRKKLSGELLAVLERANAQPQPPIIATSVRDLLVTGRRDQQRHDDRAAATLARFFDLVLVHGDPRFASIDESFRPRVKAPVRFEYTGFVAGRAVAHQDHEEVRPGTVVVSAGGGWVGGALMEAAADAAPILAERHGLRTTLITGPLADQAATERLRLLISGRPMISTVRSVPGLLPVLRQAAASVSQAGYNTTVDLLQAAIPAVLVPYGDEQEDEQTRRAARLAEHHLARVVDPTIASGPVLADAVSAVVDHPPPTPLWSLDGAGRTVSILRAALAGAQGLDAI